GVDVPVARTNVFVWDVRSGLKLSVFRPELLTILIASKTIWRNCLQAGAIAVFSGVRSPLCLVSQSDALL
ncbi:hypothetical protein, partial [Nostoc sp.]